MPKPLVIDRHEYAARPDRNLLQVCLELGIDLPYFCWHPALGSIGACRQCAVKQYRDEHDKKGRIVMACMTPAAEGVRISVEDPEARDFRASVIEWLMTNHPHDCPVCDEGGECHLQDMTVMTGHTYRRHHGPKRTFRNQDLGPFLNHEMNRCITCYRCVRFYRDYAGGDDLHAFASKNHVYFGRHHDGTLRNVFSGNLVEVCPTGVFTDRSLKGHYTRKWDLQSAPSLCVHCGIGCNTFVGERYGTLRRVLNRYNDAVNGYFLCDRGRFGYEFVESDARLRTPLLRDPHTFKQQPVSGPTALQRVIELLKEPSRVMGIGSARASIESNFALRELVGASNFVLGMPDVAARLDAVVVQILRDLPVRTPTLREIEECDSALVLGEDVLATAPRLALSLRQGIRVRRIQIAGAVGVQPWDDAGVRTAAHGASSALYLATPTSTGLDEAATAVWRATPDELARFGFAVAHEIDASAPCVEDLDPKARSLAGIVAQSLRSARCPLVVSGTGCGSEAVLQAAANVALALRRCGEKGALSLVVRECNEVGLALMGGLPLSEAFAAAGADGGLVMFVLENDLYRRADARQVDRLMKKARVVVLDHVLHSTARGAEVCLPAATFAESSGTLVSNEGRAQRFLRALYPKQEIRDAWHWLGRIVGARAANWHNPWENLDHVVNACASALPLLSGITQAAPSSNFRICGQRIPREPARYSGRTAMRAQFSVHEPVPPADADSALAFSMEGYPGVPPPALASHFWNPAWNSPQAVNKFQEEIPGVLRGGNAGVRLFEPDLAAAPRYLGAPPPPLRTRAGFWLLIPRPLSFGTEELSMYGGAIAMRAEHPTLLLARADAHDLGLAAGDEAQIQVEGTTLQLPVEIDERMAAGTAAAPIGFPGLPFLDLPAWCEVRSASSERGTGR